MYSFSSMEGEDLGAWLGLGIGGGGYAYGGDDCRRSPSSPSPVQMLFSQHVKEEITRGYDHGRDDEQASGSKIMKGERGARLRVMRSIRNNGGDGSRSRVLSLGDAGSDGGCGGGGGTRKKLQLTKEQSTLLEDSFRVHNILSHTQKHELARQLKLKPRQVEVWFQNRRARTKLKQTEVDCEFLKRCCESLTDENKQLKHELMEVRRLASAAAGSQLYVQFPRAAAMVNVCPSCEKVTVMGGGGDGDGETGKSSSSYSS
uniref:Homeobox domain-containing protein n=1 Tax=Oryza meridionalis TaxID=40149 RepID=A0A0E0E5V6_9ORYZ